MKANGMQKKKMTGNGFLLLITIALFAVMYIAGMIIFADKGFAKPQMFLMQDFWLLHADLPL